MTPKPIPNLSEALALILLTQEEVEEIRKQYNDPELRQKAFTRAILPCLPGGEEYTDYNPFNHIVTTRDIIEGWGKDSSTPRRAILEGRIRPDEYMKSGRDNIFLRVAIERLYGPQTNPINKEVD